MIDRAAIEALIKRLKHAHIGSAELDLAIESAIGEPRGVTTPAWSRSIDAALKLVPAQWRLHYLDDAGLDNGARRCRCSISMESERDVEECGSTAPLAIAVAVLAAIHLSRADHAARPAQPEPPEGR